MQHGQSNVSRRPLEGITVLELTHIVAGPTAGQILADLGANVIKVESIDGGDQSRRAPGPNSALFQFLNRNKRSISLDLKSAGKDVFLKLAEKAHIIVDNFSHGVVEKLGVSYAHVKERNRAIIWISIKGFLPGPMESRPLLDELAQMMGGLAFMTGPTGQPLRAGASIIDVGAATYGVVAALAALREAEKTGEGQLITAGLYETSVYWVGQWIAISQLSGRPSVPMPEMQQGQRMGWGVYRLFEAADNVQVFIGITSNQHWDRFCKEFGLAELQEDLRYESNAGRVANRIELGERIAETVRAISSDELQRRLEAAQVPYAPLRRPDELPQDEHLVGAKQFMEIPVATGGAINVPKLPVHMSQTEFELYRQPPTLGQHTTEILREAGISEAEISTLRSTKAIG